MPFPLFDPDATHAADHGLLDAPAMRSTDFGGLEPLAPKHPGDGTHQGPATTVLVISSERVGRAFVVQALRALGLHTLVADSAAHALSRLQTGHQFVEGLLVVGELPDGTAAALHRWVRSNDYDRLPIVGIGVDLGEDDVWARAIPTSTWFDDAPSVLVSLGLLERRAATPTLDAAALHAAADAAPTKAASGAFVA